MSATLKAEQQFDDFESMILMAMDFEKYKALEAKSQKFGDRAIECGDAGRIAGVKDRYPDCPVTFDVARDRLYTEDASLLLIDIIEELDRGIETIMLHNGVIKWSLFKITKRPKGFVAIGSPSAWVEAHYRWADIYGKSDYIKNVFPLSNSGKLMHYKIESWGFAPKKQAREAQATMNLSLSVIDDARRPGVLMAKVKDQTSIAFPVGEDFYKDFFAIREAPRETPTKRKNPIIHICKKHFRKTSISESPVKSHWRGREKISVGGISVEISTEGFL